MVLPIVGPDLQVVVAPAENGFALQSVHRVEASSRGPPNIGAARARGSDTTHQVVQHGRSRCPGFDTGGESRLRRHRRSQTPNHPADSDSRCSAPCDASMSWRRIDQRLASFSIVADRPRACAGSPTSPRADRERRSRGKTSRVELDFSTCARGPRVGRLQSVHQPGPLARCIPTMAETCRQGARKFTASLIASSTASLCERHRRYTLEQRRVEPGVPVADGERFRCRSAGIRAAAACRADRPPHSQQPVASAGIRGLL